MEQVINVGDFIRLSWNNRIVQVIDVKPRKQEILFSKKGQWVSFDEVEVVDEQAFEEQKEADLREFDALMVEKAYKDFNRSVEGVVTGLREMADRIERDHGHWNRDQDDPDVRQFKDPVSRASEMQHNIMWGVANLGTDRVIRSAADLIKAQQKLG